jgi:hypothetical protein
MDDATKRLLLQAKEEIVTLRRANELLGAKVEMIDLFACVLHTRPAGQAMGMGEDVAWKIDRAIAEAEPKALARERTAAEAQAKREQILGRERRTAAEP